MLIGIEAETNKIKQIRNIADSSLVALEVDDKIFQGFSDVRILNYCYVRTEGGFSIHPAIPPGEIDRLELVTQIQDLQIALAELYGMGV